MRNLKVLVLTALIGFIFSGCAPVAHRSASSGQAAQTSTNYCCPYTSDGVLAEWVDIAIKKDAIGKVGGGVGTVAGAVGGRYVAKKALENVPFGGLIGGFAGGMIGNKVGKNVAQNAFLDSIGGMEQVETTSDLKFASLQSLADHLYTNNTSHPNFKEALEATKSIYPEFGSYIR